MVKVKKSTWAMALSVLRVAQDEKGAPLEVEEAEDVISVIPKTFSRGTSVDDVLKALESWRYLNIKNGLITMRKK